MKSLTRILPLVLTAVCSTAVLAQLVNGRFVTSFVAWKHFDTVGASTQNLRALQGIQLSVAQDNVSLHTYMLGSGNIAGGFGDVGRVRVYNLFLRAARIARVFEFQVGRQALYAGAGYGTIDGVMARARLFGDRVTVTGFGGATVRPDFGGVRENVHGNIQYGGQLLAQVTPGLRFGGSYARRDEERDPYIALRGRDTTFNPLPVLIEAVTESEEILSGDLRYLRGERLSVYARYDHDLLLSRPSRAQAALRFQVAGPLSATIDFLYRTPRIAYNSIFSAFVANPVREIEGGVEYRVSPLVRAFGRLARVTTSDEPSHRWTVGVNSGLGTISYAGSDGYSGELQSFALHGSYPLIERKLVANAGVAFSSYRFTEGQDRQSAFSLLLGATLRPAPSFGVDVQGQLLTNPVYKNDLRVQARLTYWFAERLSIF